MIRTESETSQFTISLPQYITEPIYRNKNPDFAPIALNVERLTGGKTGNKFLIEVLDKDFGAPSDDYVGQ